MQTNLATRDDDDPELEDRLDSETIVAHRYRILRYAGSRGFGQVYQAEDSATDCAVSLMRLDREFSRPGVRDRFFATRGSAQIEHPGAVDLTDYGEDLDGRLFLVMPWIEQAEALDELLARSGKLGWARARALFEQIAEALLAAHRRGILHGGLAPSRVLVDHEARAHVLDFGLAPALESTGTTNATKQKPNVTDMRVLAADPAYLAPEQVRGETPNERTDIYALGLILWELVAGAPPFVGAPVEVLHRQLHDSLPELVRGDAPVELEAVLQLALAKDPGERFASVDELLTTLRALPVTVPTATPTTLPRTKTEPLAPSKKPSVIVPVPAGAAPTIPAAAAPSSPAEAAPTIPAAASLAITSVPTTSAPAPSVPSLAAPSAAPSHESFAIPTPAKSRFGLLEKAIVGFLLFDLALFGAWQLLGKRDAAPSDPPSASAANEPTTTKEPALAAASAEPESPADPEPTAALAPTELAPSEPGTPELGVPALAPDELPKSLSDADFRKTMVDARDRISARCLEDQRIRRTLKVSLDVSPSGAVERAKVVGPLGDTALGKCVARQAKAIEFPTSIEGGSHVYSLRLN